MRYTKPWAVRCVDGLYVCYGSDSGKTGPSHCVWLVPGTES